MGMEGGGGCPHLREKVPKIPGGGRSIRKLARTQKKGPLRLRGENDKVVRRMTPSPTKISRII